MLVLQAGPNASVDYYLRPRLEAARGLEWAIVDLARRPRSTPLLRQTGVWVVVCRYIDRRWLEALAAARSHLAGVAYFVDDDLAAMMNDPHMPYAVRRKVKRRYGQYVEDLEAVTSEVWVSTAALADQAGLTPSRILPPVPFEDPPPPSFSPQARVVYHGTSSHGADREFLGEVAAGVAQLAPAVRFEIAGDRDVERRWSALTNVSVSRQVSWPRYVEAQRAQSAAILLAPLFPGAVNRVRAPVKVFDAARLGAAGLYADAEPFRGFVRDGIDGLLLPMDASIWAAAIAGLMADPQRRFDLADAAYRKTMALRAATPPLFPLPMERG